MSPLSVAPSRGACMLISVQYTTVCRRRPRDAKTGMGRTACGARHSVGVACHVHVPCRSSTYRIERIVTCVDAERLLIHKMQPRFVQSAFGRRGTPARDATARGEAPEGTSGALLSEKMMCCAFGFGAVSGCPPPARARRTFELLPSFPWCRRRRPCASCEQPAQRRAA